MMASPLRLVPEVVMCSSGIVNIIRNVHVPPVCLWKNVLEAIRYQNTMYTDKNTAPPFGFTPKKLNKNTILTIIA